MIEKYDGWTQKDGKFLKLFALAIFFPVAPDDFLVLSCGNYKNDVETVYSSDCTWKTIFYCTLQSGAYDSI